MNSKNQLKSLLKINLTRKRHGKIRVANPTKIFPERLNSSWVLNAEIPLNAISRGSMVITPKVNK